MLSVCYFFCGKKVTKKAARKGLHPLFGMVLLFSFGTTVACTINLYCTPLMQAVLLIACSGSI